jgi:hypothetical protein|tara:strand:+ start:300 stop:557 length:258 start_codon:yes stop_codon:yes gene_type:complete
MKVTLYKMMKPIVASLERDLLQLSDVIRRVPKNLETPELLSIDAYVTKCFIALAQSHLELKCIFTDTKKDMKTLVLNDTNRKAVK